MKVYTAKEHSYEVQRVLFWWREVTSVTEVAIWPGPKGWGVGYVHVVDFGASVLQDQVVTKRHYGIIKVELK